MCAPSGLLDTGDSADAILAFCAFLTFHKSRCINWCSLLENKRYKNDIEEYL